MREPPGPSHQTRPRSAEEKRPSRRREENRYGPRPGRARMPRDRKESLSTDRSESRPSPSRSKVCALLRRGPATAALHTVKCGGRSLTTRSHCWNLSSVDLSRADEAPADAVRFAFRRWDTASLARTSGPDTHTGQIVVGKDRDTASSTAVRRWDTASLARTSGPDTHTGQSIRRGSHSARNSLARPFGAVDLFYGSRTRVLSESSRAMRLSIDTKDRGRPEATSSKTRDQIRLRCFSSTRLVTTTAEVSCNHLLLFDGGTPQASRGRAALTRILGRRGGK
jgi:hypothetical protein